MLSAIFRRAVPDGQAWDVEIIANYAAGQRRKRRVQPDPRRAGRARGGGSPDGRASSTAAILTRAIWRPIPIRRIARHETKNKTLYALCALWLILLFSACIPASPPPNLSATPGAAVVVTRDHYQNDRSASTIPTGWRVITSPAGAPPSVTFVAPGDCALIIVSSAPLDQAPAAPACDQPDIQTDAGTVTLGDIDHDCAGARPAPDGMTFAHRIGSRRRLAQGGSMNRRRVAAAC